MEIMVKASRSGPLYDGQALAAAHEVLDRSKRELADEGAGMLRSFVMDRTGRATGRYQAEITTTVLAFNDIKIHDPVVYGPWLEGVSERNRSTRFKGYHLWRRTRQALNARAKEILQKNVTEFIGRMGGS